MARLFVFLLFFCLASFAAHAGPLELPQVPYRALQFLNNGHVLEAYNLLVKHRHEEPEDVAGLFLLAMTKMRMMTLAPYEKSDRAELVALLDQVQGLTESHIATDDDALFFYSATLGLRAQLMGTEGDWWETAKLGKQMKSTSEDLIKRNPDYNEAYYLLGSYNYLADALPGYIKFLRTLIFLPGGDKVEGMKQLIRSYEKGNVVSIEAGRTLAYFYTYFEDRPDYGIQMCENILIRCPDAFDVVLYKGLNLYYASSFEKSEQLFEDLLPELHAYSRMHGVNNSDVIPVYKSLEREARYWIARSLIQQNRIEEAERILLALKTPELHQPYWIQRGVFLSLAQIAFTKDEDEKAKVLIETVLRWQEVKESHEKAKLLQKKKGKVDLFAIDFK